MLAEGGHTLLYGGSNLGTMGVLSSGAMEHGGRVVGVIPTLFSEEIISSQVVTRLVRVASMAERKEYLIAHSDAFVVLPGGIGTLDELFEVMVANQLLQVDKPVVLLNIDGFYNSLTAQLETMRRHGYLRSEGNMHVMTSVEDCMAFLNATGKA